MEALDAAVPEFVITNQAVQKRFLCIKCKVGLTSHVKSDFCVTYLQAYDYAFI